MADRYDTVGIDLVAMCVDDLICVGAEPLFLLDYIAVGAIDPERIEELVGGIAEGCRQARCALLGGETAEHGGVMGSDDLDVAGFAVGVVDKGQELGPQRVLSDDVLVGIASPGIRSNGYTLVRNIFFDRAGRQLDEPAYEGATATLADELLAPSVIYTPAVLDAIEAEPGAIHAAAHITGGGLSGNLVRSLPEGARGLVDRSALAVPEIFNEIQRVGSVADAEMERVFNLGVGMILVVERGREESIVACLARAGHEAAIIGALEPGEKDVIYR
jgi:phosphoribosylformylglycinamidine cyclo-ligase